MTRDDMELAGLVGRAHNSRDDPLAFKAAVNAIVDWHQNRWVRWLDVYEQHRAERRLVLFAEAEELERAIEARLTRSRMTVRLKSLPVSSPRPEGRKTEVAASAGRKERQR